MARDIPWGTDGVVSMPQPYPTTYTEEVDMDGFCFTPDGIRIDISHAEREDILMKGYAPQGVTPSGEG